MVPDCCPCLQCAVPYHLGVQTIQIAVDAREAYRADRTGKGQWARRCIEELASQPDVRLTLVSDAARPAEVPEACAWERIPGRSIGWHLAVARRLRRHPPWDVYLSTTSFIVPFLVGRRFPVVPVVHDLIAFRRELHDSRAQWIERLTLSRAVRSAPVTLVISESTKRDLLARYAWLDPSRVKNVYAGPMAESVAPNRSDGRTVLCAATLCPRKNQLRLIQAYAQLPRDVRGKTQLLLAGGRGWEDRAIVEMAARTPGVTWLGYVTDARYQELLGTCAVLAFPSLYEGFGLPVLDALQRGACVLTSDRGSLREVAGDAALTVDPEDVAAIRDGLEKILTDQPLRDRLRAAGPAQAARFRWQRTVDGILTAMRNAVSRA